MDFFERAIDMPRGTQKVRLEVNTRDGYLCKIYDLPDPSTGGEYMAVLDDLKERFSEGERSEFNTGDGMLGSTVMCLSFNRRFALSVINEDTLTVTTLGDSPAFLISNGVIKRVANNTLKYEDMIEQGYITRDEYKGYIQQMHEHMQSCFDWFIPEVVPPNVIEQYAVKQGDVFFMCCDGLGDWITLDSILNTLKLHGIKDGTDILIQQAKDISIAAETVYDDITAIAIQYR